MNTITADPVAHQVSQQLQPHNEYQIGMTGSKMRTKDGCDVQKLYDEF